MNRKIILIFSFLLSPITVADDRFVVHAIGQTFSVPTNCEFYARPAITAGEIRFNCSYFSPPDATTIHFRSAEFCNSYMVPKMKPKSNFDKTLNNVRYIEATDSSGTEAFTWRFVIDKEQCVYALGLYKANLDDVMQGLWKQ